MAADIQIYLDCMRDIRDRINRIQTRPGGVPMLDGESESLNFRKVIEALAYALLAANRSEYAVRHSDFMKHDKAKDILKNLEAINPECFPIPLQEPRETSPGHKLFPRVANGFFTREDFFNLYSLTAPELHSENPYAPNAKKKYSDPMKWVRRIQRLLSTHSVLLAGGDVWVVQIPGNGSIKAWPASGSLLRTPE